MLLVIDNYDSFTYNLVQYLGELKQDVRVVRNDEIPAAAIAGLAPSHVVISPGPCTPNEAGISLDTIKRYAGKIPILGVCLGHQSIGQAFGARSCARRASCTARRRRFTTTARACSAGCPTRSRRRATIRC